MRYISLRIIGIVALLVVITFVSLISYVAIDEDGQHRLRETQSSIRQQTVRDLETFIQQQLDERVLHAEQIILLSAMEHVPVLQAYGRLNRIWPRLQLTSPILEAQLFGPDAQLFTLGSKGLEQTHQSSLVDQVAAGPVRRLECENECRLFVAVPVQIEAQTWALALAFDLGDTLVTFSQLKNLNLGLLKQGVIESNGERQFGQYTVPVLTQSDLSEALLARIQQMYSLETLFAGGVSLDLEEENYFIWAEPFTHSGTIDFKLVFFHNMTSWLEEQQINFRYSMIFVGFLAGSILFAVLVVTMGPMRRLGVLTEAVTLIGQKLYPQAKALLESHQQSGYQDEIGTVHSTLKETTGSLQSYQQELLASQQHLAHLAMHDKVTGLLNRHAFSQDLQALRHDTSGQEVALLFLDLDGFKDVNDNLGHDIGDKVLKEVGLRLNSFSSSELMICRIGGDEFVLRQKNNPDQAYLVGLTQRIVENINQPILVDKLQINISASVGIAFARSDSPDFGKLLSQADIAMYEAKRNSETTYRVFDQSMETASNLLYRIKSDFESALAQGQFFVCYQPMLNFNDEKLKKMEALVRWQHPELGFIRPDIFIPVLEDTNQIALLTDWIVEQALEQILELDKSGLTEACISVNISGRQVTDPEYVQHLLSKLEKAKVSPKRIELEITETSLVSDFDAAKLWVEQAHQAGFKVAMDDFGTGYSSLSYLTTIDFDTVKLDRSLISDIVNDPVQQKVTSATVKMLLNLGRSVVVEGIEEYDQFELLRELGCHVAQGYLISKPLDSKALGQELEKYQTRQAWFS